LGFSPQISNFPCQQGSPPSKIYYQKFHLCIFNLIDQFSNHFLSASASCYFSNLIWLYIFLYILWGPKNGLQQGSQISPTTQRILVLVKGDSQNGSQVSPTAQQILVLVKGDHKKGSEVSLTIPLLLLWLKGVARRDLRLA